MPGPGWSSQLQVTVGSVVLTPITSFSTTFLTSITPIHSIEADNVGVIQKPRTMNFTMKVPAVRGTKGQMSQNVATLYKLAIAGTPFDVALAVQSGPDWVFQQLLFRGCYITSASPSDVTVGTTSGVLDTTPVATFTGIVTDFVAYADITTP